MILKSSRVPVYLALKTNQKTIKSCHIQQWDQNVRMGLRSKLIISTLDYLNTNIK